MDILGTLLNQLGEEDLTKLGDKAGLKPNQAKDALSGAIPVLLGAMAKNTSDSKGADALAGALDRDHDGSVLDNVGDFLGKGDENPGAGILKHVLGDKTVDIESGLSQKMGISSSSAGSILKMAAPLLLGMLGKQKKEKGLDSGGLGSLINMASGASGSGGLDVGDLIGMFTGGSSKSKSKGGLMGMLGSLLGKK